MYLTKQNRANLNYKIISRGISTHKLKETYHHIYDSGNKYIMIYTKNKININ